MEDLAPLGWDRERAAELAACGVPTLAPARVAVVYQDRLRVAGAASWAEFHETVIVGVQTASGFGEGKPHGRVRK